MVFSISTFWAFVLIVGIASNYIYGITRIGYFDDILVLFTFFASFIALIYKPVVLVKYNLLFIAIVIFVVISFLFLFNNINSHLYEIYKLSIFLAFFPLLAALPASVIYKIDEKILKIATIFLAINLFIIFAQYTITPKIVVYLGLSPEQITVSQRIGRWVGVFEGINNFGDIALLLFLLNEIVKPPFYKLAKCIFLISVLVSTSKHAILVCALIYLYLHIRRSHYGESTPFALIQKFYALIALSLLLIVGFFMNEEAIQSKTAQYDYFLQNALTVTNKDADKLEFRALHMASGLDILQKYPFGVGLGVWGDASSRFKEGWQEIPAVEMSDSYLIHILVEQGIFVLFYFSLYIIGLKYAAIHKNQQFFISLLIFFFLSSFVTMGLSSGSWPLLFSYIYARLITHPCTLSKKYN